MENVVILASSTMIKTFTFKNFLSFKDEIKFSLERDANDDSHKESFFYIQDVDGIIEGALGIDEG